MSNNNDIFCIDGVEIASIRLGERDLPKKDLTNADKLAYFFTCNSEKRSLFVTLKDGSKRIYPAGQWPVIATNCYSSPDISVVEG